MSLRNVIRVLTAVLVFSALVWLPLAAGSTAVVAPDGLDNDEVRTQVAGRNTIRSMGAMAA